MKIIVLDGEVLTGGKMDGIHRFMYEILSRLDNMIPDSGIEIHLVHRDTGSIKNLNLVNIKDVPLDCHGKRYRLKAVPEYVKSVNGTYCSMSNDAVRVKDSIFTIMDLIPLSKLAHYPFKALIRMKLTYHLMKKYHKKIVTISNASKNDIIAKLGINKACISVVGTGYEHMNNIAFDDEIFHKYSDIKKGNYYYAIGNQYPYKNFVWVKEVAKRNPDEMFVIAGSKTNIEDGLGDNLDNMLYIGYVSDEENKSLMKNAKAFIHPSKLEGFGMPPLEALSLGTPVIVSNASCLPEIYGECAHYIEPDNYDVNLGELLSGETAPAENVLQKYTWDKTAAQWLKIFTNENS